MFLEDLHRRRKAIVESIFWGFPWNQKKVDEIDSQIFLIHKFMYVTAKLDLHKDNPYAAQIKTERLIRELRATLV